MSGGIFNNIFLVCAFLGTGVFILKTFMPIDSGSEVGGDFTGITDTDASFNLFTIETVAAFFMCFGWMGWISESHLNYGMKIASIIAVVSGIIGMAFFGWLMSQIRKLEHTQNTNLDELINKTGKAYMDFAPKGTGKISIEFNERIEEFDARNNTDVEIKSFEAIKVVKVENNEIFIEKDN